MINIGPENNMGSSPHDGNLLIQRFADGEIEYTPTEGVVYKVETLVGVIQKGLTSGVIREAWVKWSDPAMPDTKFFVDAAEGQRFVLLEAKAKNNAGKSASERLCIFNMSTRQIYFFRTIDANLAAAARQYELKTENQPDGAKEYNAALNKIKKIVRNQYELDSSKNGEKIVAHTIYIFCGVACAWVGYHAYGMIGAVILGLLGYWFLGISVWFLILLIRDNLTRESRKETRNNISKHQAIIDRIEEIRKNLLSL